LAYSPRYFGDIVHKATGGTAIGYIHNFGHSTTRYRMPVNSSVN